MIRTSRWMKIGIFVSVFAVSFEQAYAQAVKVGDLQIDHPWSRATPAGTKVGAGYLVITNNGTSPDRLIGGSSPTAGKIEIHEMAMKDNVMTMRPVTGGLPIEPGKSVTLAPGGYHLMFVNLKSSLKQGSKLKATLEFEKAGKVDVTFDVQAIGAQGPSPSHSDHYMSGQPDHKM
jgi:periplasmic copper chaperone A